MKIIFNKFLEELPHLMKKKQTKKTEIDLVFKKLSNTSKKNYKLYMKQP